MNTARLTFLSFAVMAVSLVAGLIYTLPRRAPDMDRAKYDFLRHHRDCSVVSSEVTGIEHDAISFRILYRGFASDLKQEETLVYRQKKGQGWQLE